MLKKVICIIILGIILFSSFSIFASAFTLDESLGSLDSYYLYNFEQELVMAEKNIGKSISASSTVKMMTACIALESGVPFDKVITITNEMLKGVSGRFMGLVSGDKMTFADLLYSMICASFNDATHAIAFTISNSLESCVQMMNDKAKALGMKSTYYADITGLSSDSKTTVNDLIILAEYLSKNQNFLAITSTKSYQLSSFATCEYNKISNRSSLLSSYKNLYNFNVGSTNDNGDSTVVYYNNGDKSFMCIVMNATSSSDGNSAEEYARKLLNHALYDYSVKVIAKSGKIIDSLPVKYSVSNTEVNIYLSNDICAYISRDININEDLTYNYYLFEGELIAPLKTGDEVGMLIVTKDGKFIASEKLIVSQSVERNTFLYLMQVTKNYLSSRAFILFLIAFVGLMFGYYFYMKSKFDKMYRNIPKKTLKYYRK